MTEKHQPEISSFSSGEIHLGAQAIISAAMQTRNYPYHFMKHIHRSIEIYLIDSGSCAMDINNRKLSCTAGDFVMILPNTVHSFYLDAPDTCLFRHIHFDPAPFSRLYLNRSETDSFDMITALTVPYGHCFHLASNETFSSLIDNIIEETAENDSLHLALANLHLTELLLELMKLTRKNHALLTVSDSLSPEQIRYVSYALSYIHENFDRDSGERHSRPSEYIFALFKQSFFSAYEPYHFKLHQYLPYQPGNRPDAEHGFDADPHFRPGRPERFPAFFQTVPYNYRSSPKPVPKTNPARYLRKKFFTVRILEPDISF